MYQLRHRIDTDSAGRGGDIATHAVVRVICTDNNLGGTRFLHKSGNILTANHVVHNCGKLLLILPNSTRVDATILASDLDHDLAVLKPATPIAASPLQISTNNDFKVGAQVSTWGFPAAIWTLSDVERRLSCWNRCSSIAGRQNRASMGSQRGLQWWKLWRPANSY